MSNRAGHPQRTRKRNRLIFNEDEETSFGSIKLPSPKKPYVATPVKVVIRSKDTKEQKEVIIKPPTAVEYMKNELVKTIQHKKQDLDLYMYDNFFYSHIDQAIMLNDHDLEQDMKISFPKLKARLFPAIVWNKIDSLIGKTRRHSRRMRYEQRQMLESKRHLIRSLQQTKTNDLSSFRQSGIPEYIPHFLPVGTKVFAFIRKYGEFHYGCIEGIDASKNTYRVNFFQNEIGAVTVSDYDVAPSAPIPFFPLDSFLIHSRKVWSTPNKIVESTNKNAVVNDLEDFKKFIDDKGEEACVGDYPVRLLYLMVKASIFLDKKREVLNRLKEMNKEIERKSAFSETITHSFKQKYADTILEITKVNKKFSPIMKKLLSFEMVKLNNIKPDARQLKSDEMSHKCQMDANKIFEARKDKFETTPNGVEVKLMTILCHMKNFKNTEVGAAELQSLMNSVEECRSLISPKNMDAFQNFVEVHVNHVLGSLTHLGNVGAFSQSEFLKVENDTV